MHRQIYVLAATVALILIGPATVLASFPGTDIFLPSVGAGPGVAPSHWYTTVWVHNPGTSPANITFYLLERQANLSPLTYNDTIPAGDARVVIDPVFAQTVSLDAGYYVYLTPLGDCPLYVADKDTGGFEVRAQGGRDCSTGFDYRIVARRTGFEHLRLERVDD